MLPQSINNEEELSSLSHSTTVSRGQKGILIPGGTGSMSDWRQLAFPLHAIGGLAATQEAKSSEPVSPISFLGNDGERSTTNWICGL